MPCDTIRTVGVQLERCDAQTMLAALSEMGLQPILSGTVIRFGNNEQIDCKTGLSRLQWNRTASEIKQHYSKAIVQRTAKRFGWTVRQDAKDPMKLQVLKR